MIRSFQGVWWLLLAIVVLAGCATPPPLAEPPPTLERIVADFSLHSLWYRQAQHTRPEDYVQPGVLIHDGRVYHADRPDRIIAFDALSGREIWRTVLEPPAGSQTVHLNTGFGVGAEMIFAGTRQGRVIALDPADGSIRWEAQLASEVAAPPVGGGEIVVARSNDGRIYGLDALSGRELWVQVGSVPPLSLRGAGRPVIDAGQTYVGLANGRLISVATDTGEVLWEVAIGIAEGRSEFERLVDVDADPVLAENTVYAAAYQARLVAVSTVSGRIQWSREMSTHQPIRRNGDLLYVSTDDAEVIAVNRDNGAVLWRQDALAGLGITAPAVFGDSIVVADDQGYLHWLSAEDGRFVGRQRVSSQPIHTAPAIHADVLFVVDAGGAFQALRRIEEGP